MADDRLGNSSMADRKDFFRQIAVNYRQLAAANPEIKQRMLDMAAHYQAKADEEALSGEANGARQGRVP
jgi:hypothetical protein